MGIPDWNSVGVVPPIDPVDPTGPERSRYLVSLVDVVLKFGISPERLSILAGLLRLRAALHLVGISKGFQWLDGSFLERIEVIESRVPEDIDVVTFVESTGGLSLTPENEWCVDHDLVKASCHVDHYIEEMDQIPLRMLVSRAAYWYSVWSHRRSQLWKGFLQIDLSPTDDATANSILMSLREVGEQS